MKIHHQLKQLEQRLALLEAQTDRGQTSSTSVPPVERSILQEGPSFVVRAHFGRVALERKPFAVTLGVSNHTANLTRSLTPIRAAILLVLLMDLLERSEDSQSGGDSVERVMRALSLLSPGEAPASGIDALRVALYRAGQFLQEEFGSSEDDSVKFSIEKGALQLFYRGVKVPARSIEVEITSSDQVISSFLDRSLATSPLSRLRKAKALFVPPGEDGQDRLLLELLEHEHPVRQTSLFYRPTVQSFPQELLVKLKISPNRRRRQEVATSAYQSGRLQYLEVLQRKVLWDMIKRTPGRGFSTYSSAANAVDVLQHIDHMIFLVRSVTSYELVLTDAFFPFYITTIDCSRPEGAERVVLFFQHAEEENVRQVSVFALKDDAVFFSTHDRIIRWVLSHPTTIRNREDVLLELQAVRNALLESIESPNSANLSEPTALLAPLERQVMVEKREPISNKKKSEK